MIPELNALAAAIPALSEKDRATARDLIDWAGRRGLSPKQLWLVGKLVERATTPRPAAEAVGAIAPIVALINRAKSRLKWPAILIDTDAMAVRLSVAGPTAREPGSITITTADRGAADGRRTWLGRITHDGLFEASSALPAPVREAIRVALVAFAADPAGVAAAYGHRTGHCCFCARALDDPRSTEVGYGPICAGHFGLAWGNRPGWNQRTCEAA